MTALYLNTDDFMVIADNGRVLGVGFTRASSGDEGKNCEMTQESLYFQPSITFKQSVWIFSRNL